MAAKLVSYIATHRDPVTSSPAGTGLRRIDDIHIELSHHDVIWAEGAASETYLEDDNRGQFHNVGEFGLLYPAADQAPVFSWVYAQAPTACHRLPGDDRPHRERHAAAVHSASSHSGSPKWLTLGEDPTPPERDRTFDQV